MFFRVIRESVTSASLVAEGVCHALEAFRSSYFYEAADNPKAG
jgi:hypothetical protein